MKELFTLIKKSFEQKENLVLALIAENSGSTPRGQGAWMLVNKTGRIAGTIGGAKPEFLAIEEGKKIAESGVSALKTYILHPAETGDIGAICGGEITVFLQYLGAGDSELSAIAGAALNAVSLSVPAWLVIKIDKGREKASLGILGKDSILAWKGTCPEETVMLRKEKPLLHSTAQGDWLSLPVNSTGIVYVFGSGHVARELLPLLGRLDFRCIVFDDREEYCKGEFFPAAEQIITGNYEDIGASIPESLTGSDYAVILTRGHLWDFQAEVFALKSPAHYIGAIGSRTKHAAVRQKLLAAGFSEADLDAPRFHAPIGIDIGSDTPAEIAVSIAAELIKVRNCQQGGF
ncbi:MAG: XdhC family protein [Treponema sp.]|jgi:xanthine dehydrogenase accessory factor|nr:XdhC family protein [Treponema sp.]